MSEQSNLMNKIKIKNIELAVVSFVWIVLFATPVLFREDYNNPVWKSIRNQLEILIPVMILFLFNRIVFVPYFLFKKKFLIYILSISLMILFISFGSYFYDTRIKHPSNRPVAENSKDDPPPEPYMNPNRPVKNPARPGQRQPRPVSPFANVIVFSVLLVGLDTGLKSGLRWMEAENEKVRLEKENVATQLVLLRNQVSPHFFMNTLNNIYSLIDSDKERSKESVMRLSKLMRYLLYENQNEKVLLSKEFDFVKNYFGLMKLRLVDDVEIKLKVPDSFADVEIPVMLFFPYLENAFKYGTSYQNKSKIEATFEVEKEYLVFSCKNSKNVFSEKDNNGGTGFQSSRKRLDLLYNDKYSLLVNETDDNFYVTLRIPLT
jgi:hypothetical protein